MLQVNAPESWVSQHFWNIVQFLVLFAGIVGAWFTLRGDVQTLKLEQSEMCDRMERVESHITDTARHRDPERDERRLQSIERGIDDILKELRRIGRFEKI